MPYLTTEYDKVTDRHAFEYFDAYVADVAALRRREQGRWPSADVWEEWRLARALQAWQSSLASGDLPLGLELRLDERLPGWRPLVRRSVFFTDFPTFEAQCRVVQPTSAAPQHWGHSEESWLHSQRTQLEARRLSARRIATLDRRFPGWRAPHLLSRPFAQLQFRPTALERQFYADFDTTLDAACAFFEANGDLPLAWGESRDEQRLGRWLCRLRELERCGRMCPDRADELDSRLEAWRRSLPERCVCGDDRICCDDAWGQEVWFEHADYVAQFAGVYGRPPEPRERFFGCNDCLFPSPQRLVAVGAWLAAQREALAGGRLSGVQRRLLDAVAPGWDAPALRPRERGG